jgi:hypothetical protein
MNYISENETRYAVKVNGKVVTQPFTTQTLSEHALLSMYLSEDQRLLAQVVPVTPDGREILLG